MEALAAISLVAAIAQFVDYSHRLLSNTAEIVRSVDGATAEALKTENIFGHVQRLSEALAAPSAPGASGAVIPEPEATALRDLAALCRNECTALLDAVGSTKATTGNGHSHYGSFKAALKVALGAKKLSTMQATIGTAQTAISLQVQKIIGRQIEAIQTQLDKSSRENSLASLQQGQRIDQLREGVAQLQMNSHRQSTAVAAQVGDLAARMTRLTIQSMEAAKEVAFLSSLADRDIKSRQAMVEDAGGGTLDWVWNSGLSSWLESGSGIFWIEGKPGSGKSTLMKYIVGRNEVVDILSKWAAPRTAVVASHFFWSSGTDLQRSQQGLLQSLLFDILRKCPSSIPRACPGRWESNRPGALEASWTVRELVGAIRAIAGAPELPTCLCIFIDGLDEYSGDHLDLCQLLSELSQASSHLKLCVSSRPWNVFRNAFGDGTRKTLKIDDFTREDIRRFARSRLEGHPRWKHCSLSDSDRNTIIYAISTRAEGVFLWVFLVTRSLREGLTDDDSMDGLMKRLDSLPKDLERLFKGILDGVDPLQHEKMAAMLQTTIQERYPRLELYYHQELELERPGYSLALSCRPITESDRVRITEKTKRWINARSGGLLHVASGSGFGDTVSFIHRTVREFLDGKEMTEYLHSKLSQRAADPYLRIAKAHSAVVKTGKHLESCHAMFLMVRRLDSRENAVRGLLHALEPTLRATALVAPMNLDSVVELIDDLEDSLVKAYARPFEPRRPTDPDVRTKFREMVLQTDNADYLARKLADGYEYQLGPGVPLLCKVLPTVPFQPYARRVQRVLLEHGHDPNSTTYDTDSLSGWALVVRMLWEQDLQDRRETLRSGVLSAYLDHGADPNANTMCWSERTGTGEMVFETENIHNVIEGEGEDGRIWTTAWFGGRTRCGKGERCHLSAFAYFLLLHFGQPVMDSETEDRYITLLREFLAAGADFEDRILLSYGFWGDQESQWHPLGVISGGVSTTTIAKAFCHGLRELPVRRIAGVRGQNALRRQLFRITREILVAGTRRSWDLSELLGVVPSFFSQEQTASLLGASKGPF